MSDAIYAGYEQEIIYTSVELVMPQRTSNEVDKVASER